MLAPVFPAPVVANQVVFRAVMDAVARPGEVKALPPVIGAPSPPERNGGGARAGAARQRDAAVARSAARGDTGRRGISALPHRRAPSSKTRQPAAFALVAEPASLPPFERFCARHAGISRPLDDARPGSRKPGRRAQDGEWLVARRPGHARAGEPFAARPVPADLRAQACRQPRAVSRAASTSSSSHRDRLAAPAAHRRASAEA